MAPVTYAFYDQDGKPMLKPEQLRGLALNDRLEVNAMTGQTLVEKEIEFLNGLLTGIQTITEMDPDLLKASVARLAYYKAERRGFAQGCELSDWLAAENEVYERISRRTIPPVGPD